MPIAPVFPGETASGGGGVSLDAVPFGDAIDLTDGWTLEDPDSVVDTTYGTNGVTFSGGFNTVQFNAFGANSIYNWGSTSDHHAPRWHKPLLINSVRMTSDDLIDWVSWLSLDRSIIDAQFEVVSGPCAAPTSTTANTIGGMGAAAHFDTGRTYTMYGVWTVTADSLTGNTSGVRVMATGLYGGQHSGSACSTILNASNVRTQNTAKPGAAVLSAGTDLFMMIGIGMRSNSVSASAGDQIKFSAYQSAAKWVLP
jgi:hypothetical protein